MNSMWCRGNALLAFTLSVLAGLTVILFLSTAFHEYKGDATLGTAKTIFVKNIQDVSMGRTKNDVGFVTLNLKADLRHLFNWNVKQIFLYLTAEYITARNNVRNQVVVWDKIIRRGENSVLDYKNIKTKYYFFDDGNGLKGNKNISLTLSWNIIPNAGSLPNYNANGNHLFSFPSEYMLSAI